MSGDYKMTKIRAVEPFEDPEHELNGMKYHTGKMCVCGCGRKAGTAWSPYFCFECNVKRMKKIDCQIKTILFDLRK